MVSPKVAVIGAIWVAVTSVSAGPLSSGICYSPWHHASVNNDVVQKDFAQMKEHFSGIRTYHARFGSVNVIDAAAQAGIQVAVGVMMQDRSQIDAEIKAVCEGAKRHPSTVTAVYVGNENLHNGGTPMSGGELNKYINQVKGCVSTFKIPVGTVQRINEWLKDGDAKAVADNSDVIGVNVYPFFTPGPQTPIEKLDIQWKQMTGKYTENKIRLTETGWPRQGSSSPSGQVPSKQTTQTFLNDFAKWAKSKPQAYYFMMYDLSTNNGPDYEKYFGLADTQGRLQVTIPSGDGTTKAPDNTTPAPASTQATTSAPAVTPAATTHADIPNTPNPTSPSSTSAAGKPTVAVVTTAPSHVDVNPAVQKEQPVVVSPQSVATPAPTKRLRKHKHHCVDSA